MNIQMSSFLVSTFFLLSCVFCDYKSGRIPNLLTVSGAASGMALSFAAGGTAGFLSSAAGFLVPPGALWLLFKYRMLGAGDLKMLAMTGSFSGFSASGRLLFLVFLSGGLLSLAAMLCRKNLKKRLGILRLYVLDSVRNGKPGPYPFPEKDGQIRFSLPVLAGFWLMHLIK